MSDTLRKLIAELLGTFALVFVAAGTATAAHAMPDKVSTAAEGVAPGLTIGALIYAIGDVSGAHFNPVVSLAFTLKRLFPLAWLPLYWIAQLAGALLAALALRLIFGDVAAAGVSEPHIEAWDALALEIVLTWLLVTVILATADRARIVGPNAALAVGATIAAAGLFALPLEGASMNPAISSGPAVVNAKLDHLWIYVIGPAIGSVLAVVTTVLVHGPNAINGDEDRKSEEAAQGEEHTEDQGQRRRRRAPRSRD